MNLVESLPSSRAAASPSLHIAVLSPFVNERFPDWGELLSAHDVARLTRRPRWVLAGLVLFGQFPRKRRYHGRQIGWLRSDVLSWLTKDLNALPCRTAAATARRGVSRQGALPLECAYVCTVRRSRTPCMARVERPSRPTQPPSKTP